MQPLAPASCRASQHRIERHREREQRESAPPVCERRPVQTPQGQAHGLPSDAADVEFANYTVARPSASWQSGFEEGFAFLQTDDLGDRTCQMTGRVVTEGTAPSY